MGDEGRSSPSVMLVRLDARSLVLSLTERRPTVHRSAGQLRHPAETGSGDWVSARQRAAACCWRRNPVSVEVTAVETRTQGSLRRCTIDLQQRACSLSKSRPAGVTDEVTPDGYGPPVLLCAHAGDVVVDKRSTAHPLSLEERRDLGV